MTMWDDDEEADLREAFAALRREDAEKAPPFEAVLAGAGAARGRRGLAPLLGGLAAVSVSATLFAVLTVRRSAPTPPPMASIEQWTAPTDFLLRTPGHEILETVPRIGARPSLALPEEPAAIRSLPK
jgi:hypothetical protein